MQLVINSKFRPFSYDELIKPMLQYKEAYDKVEADYSNLAAQTEQWKDIANQTQSPEAYAMYSKYSNDLNNIVDDFSKGMTLKNRGQLLAMKRRYASDIEPIAKADAAMKEANDLRVKAGPDAIFEVGEYNSLDQFLHGKRANNRYQSRDALTKRTAAMTEAAMASAMKDPEFKKAMGDQYWMLTQHTGGSYEDLKAAIANNAQAQNRFAEIKAQVMKDAGYDRYDARGKQAIEDAVNTGLYAGLDKPARSFQANQDFMSSYQKAQLQLAKNADARAERQFELSAYQSGLKYNKNTKTWEHVSNPNENAPSTEDLKALGYNPEVDTNNKETGRFYKTGKNGNRTYYEIDPSTNQVVKSASQKNTQEYLRIKVAKEKAEGDKFLEANKANIAPFYFRTLGNEGGGYFENYDSYDPGFNGASTARLRKTVSSKYDDYRIEDIIPDTQNEIRNYVRRLLAVSETEAPNDKVNSVIQQYMKIKQDNDWFSANHWQVSINGLKELPPDKDGNVKYDLSAESSKQILRDMRKAVTN